MDSFDDDKLKALDARLSRIEQLLNITPASKNIPANTASPTPTVNIQAVKTKPAIQHNTLSSRWLASIAILCFVLAAGFIIKLSIDTGWLTPLRQIGLAILFGVSLIGCGLLFVKKDKEYGSFLPAAGVIILYISVFTAFRLYDLITFEVGIISVICVSIICIWLYIEIRNDVYAIAAAIGTYSAPFFLNNAMSMFTLDYILVCSLTYAVISILLRTRLLTIISAYLAIVTIGLFGDQLHQDRLIVMAISALFFLFSLSTYFFSLRNKRILTETESWAFFPVLILFYATLYYYIFRINPSIAPWIGLGFAAFLFCLYLWAAARLEARHPPLASSAMILAFCSIVAFHSVYLELIPSSLKWWLLVVIALGLAIKTPQGQYSRKYFIPLFAIFIIFANEYLTLINSLSSFINKTDLPVAFAVVASLWILIVRQESYLQNRPLQKRIVLSLTHTLAVLAFYKFTQPYNSLAVSVSWLLYALFVMLFAYYRQDKIIGKSAMLILVLAAGKALLYDAAAAPTYIRIFCLITTGVVLYGCGFLVRRIDKWELKIPKIDSK